MYNTQGYNNEDMATPFPFWEGGEGPRLEPVEVKSGDMGPKVITPTGDIEGFNKVTVKPIEVDTVTVEATEVEQIVNPKRDYIRQVIVKPLKDKPSTIVKPLTVKPKKEGETITAQSGEAYSPITVEPLNLERLRTRSTSQTQTIKPPAGVIGFESVLVEPVEEIVATPLTVYPSTDKQVIEAPEGGAYNPVIVEPTKPTITVKPIEVEATGEVQTITAPEGEAYSPITVKPIASTVLDLSFLFSPGNTIDKEINIGTVNNYVEVDPSKFDGFNKFGEPVNFINTNTFIYSNRDNMGSIACKFKKTNTLIDIASEKYPIVQGTQDTYLKIVDLPSDICLSTYNGCNIITDKDIILNIIPSGSLEQVQAMASNKKYKLYVAREPRPDIKAFLLGAATEDLTEPPSPVYSILDIGKEDPLLYIANSVNSSSLFSAFTNSYTYTGLATDIPSNVRISTDVLILDTPNFINPTYTVQVNTLKVRPELLEQYKASNWRAQTIEAIA